jgi:hypothetical protein
VGARLQRDLFTLLTSCRWLLFVEPAHRGKGVGSLLLEEALSETKGLALGTEEGTRAVDFYQKQNPTWGGFGYDAPGGLYIHFFGWNCRLADIECVTSLREAFKETSHNDLSYRRSRAKLLITSIAHSLKN